MTEKVSLIKNPLTIIAIFAGIAEVSGTVVLPFIAAENQELFIWFLISFPSILVIAFFVTLNFNNKALYAPSDYKDEGNYILSNKYSATTQMNAIVKEPISTAFDSLAEKIDDLQNRVDTNINRFSQGNELSNSTDNVKDLDDIKNLYSYQITVDMHDKLAFLNRMKKIGYNFKIYRDPILSDHSTNKTPSVDSRGIWLGTEVPLEIAKQVLDEARRFYPFLNYIKLTDFSYSEDDETREIFLGGSTESAIGHLHLLPIGKMGFAKIQKTKTLLELHELIQTFASE